MASFPLRSIWSGRGFISEPASPDTGNVSRFLPVGTRPQFRQPSGTATASASFPMTFEFVSNLHWLYSFRDYLAVTRFLFNNPELGPLLLDAYVEITDRMTGILRPALEIFLDPEGDCTRLYLILPTPLPVKEARRMLAEFDVAWSYSSASAGWNKLCVDMEYL